MTDEIKVLKELKDFNENFFELYARLNQYKKFIASEEQFRFMADKIFEQYKTQYELFRLKHELDNQRNLYSARLKCSALIPARHRHWLLWKRDNRAAQLLSEEIRQEVEAFFAKEEEAIFSRYANEENDVAEIPACQGAEIDSPRIEIPTCVAEGACIVYSKGTDLIAAQSPTKPDPNGSESEQATKKEIPPADSAPLAISEESPTMQEPAENTEPVDEWEIVEEPTPEEETPLEQIARVQKEQKPKPKKSKKKSGEKNNGREGDQT